MSFEQPKFNINPVIRLQLDLYCTNLRFTYDKKVVDTFFDKVFNALFKDDRFIKDDSTFVVLHLIATCNCNLERKLLLGFLKYLHTFIDKPLY